MITWNTATGIEKGAMWWFSMVFLVSTIQECHLDQMRSQRPKAFAKSTLVTTNAPSWIITSPERHVQFSCSELVPVPGFPRDSELRLTSVRNYAQTGCP